MHPKSWNFWIMFSPINFTYFSDEKTCLVWILDLKMAELQHFLFWPSESPSYNYVHFKFLIFIESTYFSHMMITRGGAVQFSKTVVTLPLAHPCYLHLWLRCMFCYILTFCDQFESHDSPKIIFARWNLTHYLGCNGITLYF